MTAESTTAAPGIVASGIAASGIVTIGSSDHSEADASGNRLMLWGAPLQRGGVPVDGAALLTAICDDPMSALRALEGSWAVVLCRPDGSCLLATDRLGRQPLYWRHEEAGLEVGAAPGEAGGKDLDPQALYDYVFFHVVPAPRCIYRGWQKLEAGQYVQLNGGSVEATAYWLPHFSEQPRQRDDAAADELHRTLRGAVARHLNGRGRVGAFLSGGLDSSTVAGLVVELAEGGCDAYAIGFDAPGYDEMPFARATASHFGIRLHEYYVTPEDVEAAFPQLAAAFIEPFGNSSALPAYFCARQAAADGIGTLLAGDGGDELFAGNERYLKQKLFAPWEHLPRGLRRGLLGPLIRAIPDVLPGAGKARSFLAQAETPLPARVYYYSFLEQTDAASVFEPDFLKQADGGEPRRLLADLYERPATGGSLQRMLYLDWQVTLADNDLRKVSEACRLGGVDVSYPLLDDSVVEFSASLAPGQLLPGRKLRHFYREAMRGWLPEATLSKEKHGFGLPFGLWLRTHAPLRELAYGHIIELASRGIFRRDFIDTAIRQHREGHASYYGELIWILAALELWLKARAPEWRVN